MRKRAGGMRRIYELLIRSWEYKVSDIKIFVTHTPNQSTMRVKHPLFYDVIAGSDFQTKAAADGMFLDNQGENISSKN